MGPHELFEFFLENVDPTPWERRQRETLRREPRYLRPSAPSATLPRRAVDTSRGLLWAACSEGLLELRRDTRTPRPTRRRPSFGTITLSSTTCWPQRSTFLEPRWFSLA